MSTLITTVDLGNTRCKVSDWWLTVGSPVELLRAEAVDGDWPRAWCEGQRVGAEEMLVALSSVAAEERERHIARSLARVYGASFVGTPDSGLDNRCRAPAQVGRDRLFAARGAFELGGRSAIVIDVGTAMTVDALLVAERGDAAFLGGAIAAGPTLLSRALALATARLPEVDPVAHAAALGRDTREAIASGALHGLRGAARELARRIAEEAGFAAPAVFVTGGASAFLAGCEFGLGEVRVEPQLVPIGIAAAALDRGGKARRYGSWR